MRNSDRALSARSLKEIGEQGLLQVLQRFCPAGIVGDDAAVLTTAPDQSLVITTDVLVDGVHFSDRTTSAQDVGWRAAAANLSDLAAMGATPLGITVGLSLPGDTSVDWVEQLYQGLTACLQPYNTPIVGGDITRSPVTTLAITAFGQVDPDQAIYRSAAKPGDAIVATGVHGASRAGLELLLHPEAGQVLDQRDHAKLIQAHQRPIPRLDVLPILKTILSAQTQTPKVAGMDSSDGLADAIVQICRASGVGARVERSQIPTPSGCDRWLTSDQLLQWALYGGEDFELVLCLETKLAEALVQHVPGSAIVGTITSEPDVLLGDRHQQYPDQVLTLQQGFQHF